MGTFREACLENAADQIESGRRLQAWGKVPHLVYHMATLALEEVGKSQIHTMGRMASDVKGEDNWGKNQLDDHEKKLFWALWGMSLAKEVITPKQVEDFRGLAKQIHEKRLEFLYVSDETLPRDKVSIAEALNILELAESRLNLERCYEPAARTREQIANAEWIFDKINDKESRKIVLSKESMEKMVELGSIPAWFSWLRELFARHNAELAELMRQEMAKTPVEGDHKKLKWRVLMHMDCVSHSVRDKDLAAFSKAIERIKMTKGKTDKQIKVYFYFDAAIPVKELMTYGYAWASRFAIALNIASMGFIWWNIPDEPDRFFESVENTEDKLMVEILPQDGDGIKIDFRNGNRMEVLRDQDLLRATNFMVVLSSCKNTAIINAYTTYMDAIALMAKCDVRFNHVASAFAQMCQAIHMLMMAYGHWDGKSPFLDALNEKAADAMSAAKDDFSRLIGIGIDMLSGKRILHTQKPTAESFIRIKYLFDGIAAKHLQAEWQTEFLDKANNFHKGGA